MTAAAGIATVIATVIALASAPRELVFGTGVSLVGAALLTWATWWILSRISVRRRSLASSALLEEAKVDRALYEQAIATLVDRSVRRPVREKLKVVYFIGRTPEEDITQQKWETAAAEADKPIGWHFVQANASGAGVPQMQSFKHLQNVEAWQTVGELERRLPLIPVNVREGFLWGLVFFKPEIMARSPRKWRLQYLWPGAWNNFRTDLEGECSVNLRDDGKEVHWELLEVEVVFPSGARAIKITPSEPMPVTDADVDEQGRRHFTFRIDQPRHIAYMWRLVVESLDDYPGSRTRAASPR